jgi:hypothetical protein
METLRIIRSILLRAAVVAGLAVTVVACPAVYPEVRTALRPPGAGQVLDPAPPSDIRWLRFRGAVIPQLTRDGRRWGNELSNGMPDPYAKLLVNGVEVLRTTVQRNTLTPSWPDSPGGNFRVSGDDKLRIELWDAKVINDQPIGIRDLGRLDTDVDVLPELDVECESGARVRLAIEPAHGLIGYGLSYELRTYDVYVTKVYAESPAARVGLRVGDRVDALDGRLTRTLDEAQIQSIFNAPRPTPLPIAVRHEDGSQVHVLMKQGAVYPLFREYGPIK